MASEYWEGFYAFGEGSVVRLGEGPDGGTATGYSLRDGKQTFSFGFRIEEEFGFIEWIANSRKVVMID